MVVEGHCCVLSIHWSVREQYWQVPSSWQEDCPTLSLHGRLVQFIAVGMQTFLRLHHLHPPVEEQGDEEEMRSQLGAGQVALALIQLEVVVHHWHAEFELQVFTVNALQLQGSLMDWHLFLIEHQEQIVEEVAHAVSVV